MRKIISALFFSSLLAVLFSGVFNDVSATEVNRVVKESINDNYVVQPYAIEVRVKDTYTQNHYYGSGWGNLENIVYRTYYVQSGIEDLGPRVVAQQQFSNYMKYFFKHDYRPY